MNTVSKAPLTFAVWIACCIALGKAASVAVLWLLPAKGVSIPKEYTFTPEYIRVDLARVMGIAVQRQTKPKRQKAQEVRAGLSIDSLILKGLYGNEHKGYVIVARKNSPAKTEIVGIGEVFEGYKLKSIGLDYAIFTRGLKEYRLEFEKRKKLSSTNKGHRYRHDTLGSDGERTHVVERNDVEYFAKNPREIWKNISISEIRKGSRIEGLRVRWIKPGSKFAKLGLKKGDVIIKANNKRLKSYRDAIDIYTKIDKLSELSIVVLRNGEEKELIYEID